MKLTEKPRKRGRHVVLANLIDWRYGPRVRSYLPRTRRYKGGVYGYGASPSFITLAKTAKKRK